jgi:signal transduction histidine kinase
VETIELRGFLTEVSNHFNPQFEAAGISFHLDAHENFWIDADPYRLEQAIANLYSNAIRYAPGTSLRTTTSWKDGCVEIRVKDKGPGISKEAQNRIFSRFERGDSRSKSLGLGLGLYISKEIIESHQGSIFVESNPGDGATFVVRLPARRD